MSFFLEASSLMPLFVLVALIADSNRCEAPNTSLQPHPDGTSVGILVYRLESLNSVFMMYCLT